MVMGVIGHIASALRVKNKEWGRAARRDAAWKAEKKAPEGEVKVYNSKHQLIRTEDAGGNTVSINNANGAQKPVAPLTG